MFCPNCGTALTPGSKFCPECGAPISESPAAPETPAIPEAPVDLEATVVLESPTAPEPPVDLDATVVLESPTTPKAPEAPKAPAAPTTPPPPPAPAPSGGNTETLTLVLRVVCGVLGAVFAFFALRGAFNTIRSFFNIVLNLNFFLHFNGFFGTLLYFIVTLLSNLLSLLVPAVAAVALLLAAAKWDKKHNDFLLCGVAAAAILRVIKLILDALFSFLLRVIVYDGYFPLGRLSTGSLLHIFGYVAVVGVVFLLMYLMGCAPVLGETVDQIKANVRASITELTGKFGAKDSPTDATPTTAPAAPKSAPAVAPTPAPAAPAAVRPLKTNRGLLVYILLSIVTCGIYQYFFIHGLAKDANEVCAEDGQKTGGLLAFLLLGMITCGIYNLIWWYKLCNRMATNAPRYGLVFQENGTTYLLWVLLGSLLCGLGPLIALHFALRNMNALCAAYNQRNGVYG